jgi:RNA polymerase sigma-70 factor, ECF subfamily
MRQRPVLRDGDGDAPAEKRHACVADLYQRYAPALFEYIRRHTAALNDAEDVLAEVFIGALGSDLPNMSADQQRAWLWMVARNKVNDQYRRARRQQPQVSLEALLDTLEDGATPEKLALQREEAAYLRTYLRGLTAFQQEVLQLRFIAGLRCTEIAALLNKREGAVRSILSRALNELRKYYKR